MIALVSASGCFNATLNWTSTAQIPSYSLNQLPPGSHLTLSAPVSVNAGDCLQLTASLVDGNGNPFTLQAGAPLSVISSDVPPGPNNNGPRPPSQGDLYLDTACQLPVSFNSQGSMCGPGGCPPQSNLSFPGGQSSFTFSGRTYAFGTIYLMANLTANLGATTQLSVSFTQPFSTVSLVAGPYGPRGYTASPTAGAQARFNAPESIAISGSYLYIADIINGVIRRMLLSSPETVDTIVGQAGVYMATDGPAASATVSYVHGMTSSGTTVYFMDQNALRAIDLVQNQVTTLAGQAFAGGHADSIDPTQARFADISGIATDGTYVYLAETFFPMGSPSQGFIRRYNITTHAVDTLVLSGSPSSLSNPRSIAIVGTDLYLSDCTLSGGGMCTSNLLRVNLVASNAVNVASGGMAYDYAGVLGTKIYLTTNGSSTVHEFSTSTQTITNAFGTAWGDVDGTTATAAFGNRMSGIAGLSGTYNGANGSYVFIADSTNHSIRVIDIVGLSVTTAAGPSGLTGFANSTGSAARFTLITAIARIGTNTFVADGYNSVIRKIDNVGTVSTFYTMPEGAAAVPLSLATDGTYLYFAKNNSNVQKVDGTNGTMVYNAIPTQNAVGVYGSYNSVAYAGGSLYLADSQNSAIYRTDVNNAFAVQGVIGVSGIANMNSVPGDAVTSRFARPISITATPDQKTLFVMNQNDGVLQKIDISNPAAPMVTNLAGHMDWMSRDGIGLGASFHDPVSITTDGTYIYVSEPSDGTIRRVTISSGLVLTLNANYYPEDLDGPFPSSGSVSSPLILLYDPTAGLYVSNEFNLRLLH